MSTGCVEGCLPLILLAYPNQVVGIPKIQLGEVQMQRRGEVGGVTIFNHNVVKSSVVNA
jgi:hypothetical protein